MKYMILFLSLLVSIIVCAQGPGGGQRPPGPPPNAGPGGGPQDIIFALLDLTAAQKDQIKKIRDDEKNASTPFHQQLKNLHDQLEATTKDGNFNEAAARTILAQMQQPEIELHILHLKTGAAIYQILTPAQQAKLAELREKMATHGPPPPPPNHPE